MRWTNFHTHSKFCDGDSEPELIIEEAVNLNMAVIGFSSHAPLPFPYKGVLDPDRFDEYKQRFASLKEKYKNKIEIYCGLELDFAEGWISDCSAEYIDNGLDYTIGSIHFFPSEKNTKPYIIDSSREEFSDGVNNVFRGNIQKSVSSYYSTVRKMVKEYKFDVIGHLDLVKKNNGQNFFFNENEPWYINEIKETIDVISKSGKIIELNTGGINRKKTDSVYPSPWIIEMCRKKNIPMTLNSDAHSPKHLVGYYSQAAEILLNAGYRELFVLKDKKWVPFGFSIDGIKL